MTKAFPQSTKKRIQYTVKPLNRPLKLCPLFLGHSVWNGGMLRKYKLYLEGQIKQLRIYTNKIE